MTRLGSLPSGTAVDGDALTLYFDEIVDGLAAGSDNAAANTTAINNAITAAIATGSNGSVTKRGKRIAIPPGEWWINDSILISAAFGVQLIGIGKQSALIWTGNDNQKPVILMDNARQCTISGLYIVAQNAALCGIQCRRGTVDTGMTPTKNRFIDIVYDGGGVSDYGIELAGLGSADANNDFNYFETCEVSGYTTAGWRVGGSQSYNNYFVNCHAIGDGSSLYGVRTGAAGGTFSWHGGSLGGHAIADFSVGRSYQPYVMEGFNSEQSNALLHLIDDNYQHVVMRDFRWSGVGSTGLEIIDQDSSGDIQLEIANGVMGDGQSPTAAFILRVALNSNSSFILNNSRLFTSAENPFPGDTPTGGAGNIKITDEATFTRTVLTWA